MNRLVDYGIHNEKSDIRAHVGVLADTIYVYPRKDGLDAMNKHKGAGGRLLPAYSLIENRKVKTAEGYAVPLSYFRHLHRVPIYEQIHIPILQNDSTTLKGEKAVKMVHHLMQGGGFPFKLLGRIIDTYSLQIEGVDIIVNMQARVQVKCDFRAGVCLKGCTGNLFLQVSESNPLKQY